MKKIILLMFVILTGSIMNAQYNSIAIVGNGVGGWPTGAAGEVDTHQMTSIDGINWSIENLVTTAGAVKFRAGNSWTTNWGAPAGVSFPSGVAVPNGSANISVPVGVYNVTFNSTTLVYNFAASNLYPVISIAGAGVGNSDIDLGTTDGIHYTGNGISINGEIKFSKNHADAETWTPPVFPSGTAIANQESGLNVANGIYNVSFNLTTLDYAFNYPSIALVGSGTPQGWPADPQTDTHVLATTDGIHYVLNSITLTNAAVKFRQDNSYTVQWGGDGGFPYGTGSQNGIDINVPAGTFSVTFNKLTGAYAFQDPIGTAVPPNCTLVNAVSAVASTGNAALAIDGDSSTKWQSAAAGSENLTVDLGMISTVSAVSITWDTYSAVNYFLRGSTDGTIWVAISEENNMEYGARTDIIDDINAQYRYIKVEGVTPNTQFGYGIYEINVCGTPIITANQKRILFIGNSYTYYNAMPTMVEDVAASMGKELIAASSTVGGTSLEAHFTNTGTLGKLEQGGWDYVVLQENSTRPALQDSYVEENVFPFAAQLADLARNNSPCADLFFYQTWGRETGDPDNCPTIPEVCTYEGMDDRLKLRYDQMAEDNDAAVSPVGSVRRQIRLQHPEIDLYVEDQSHPTLIGSYVSAITFYTSLYREDPTLIPFNSTISATVADQIKAIVKSVVYDNLEMWNIGSYDPAAAFTYEATGNNVSFTNSSSNSETYSWNFGDGTTSEEQNPQHDFTGAGPFTVTLTATKCGKQSTITQIIAVLATSQFRRQNLTIFPNPTTNNWNISASQGDITAIQITDLTGKIVLNIANPQGTNTKVDASQLSKGVYIAKVTGENYMQTFKLIKD